MALNLRKLFAGKETKSEEKAELKVGKKAYEKGEKLEGEPKKAVKPAKSKAKTK